MDPKEKKKLRERLGEVIDLSRTRLSDDDAELLGEFVDNYDDVRGYSRTRTQTHSGWSSDGKYIRTETRTNTFTDDVGIRADYSYRDDDGATGEDTTEIRDGRGIVNWLRSNRSTYRDAREQHS